MKRKIYDTLLSWKRTSNGKSAVMLDGARRVGKSYIAEEFAKNEYAAYLVIDFATAPRKVKRYFEEYLDEGATTFFCKIFPNPLDTRRILWYSIEHGN